MIESTHIFNKVQQPRLHMPGEFADEFIQLNQNTNNPDNISCHFLLATIASSNNSYYQDFSDRSIGKIGEFNNKNLYEHSGTARINNDKSLIILSIAFNYYNKYTKQIKTFEELYEYTTRQLCTPINLAAARGMEILKEGKFDLINDNLINYLRENYV